MALRDFWRNVRSGRDHEHERYPPDPLSPWHDEAEARYGSERGDSDQYGGSSNNPFYGDRPLTHAGATYDSNYFGSHAGLPMTPWRQDADAATDFDDLVYGGRSFDADASGVTRGHRGRGPRGYSRSDERIKEDVCQCLTDDRYVDATEIDVAVDGREVVLSGTVNSRMQKRRAEDLIERVPGVRDVINGLRVL